MKAAYLIACTFVVQTFAAPEVRFLAVPNGGIAPDAAISQDGTVHVAYVVGEDVWHSKLTDGAVEFSKPMRVNSQPNRAHAGMFRGPDIALGKNGRPEIVWYSNGYQRKLPKEDWGALFSRLNDAGDAFEPMQNLNRKPSDNYSIAADGQGRVTVLWMAGGLFLQESRDDGATFGEPKKISVADTCECCGSRAEFLADGTLVCAYRDKQNNARDMYLLLAPRDTADFARTKLSETSWVVNACPMTGNSLLRTKTGLVAAWETKTQIHFARCDVNGKKTSATEIAAGKRGGKYPLALVSPDGTTLVTWKRGNNIEWQLFDANDQVMGEVQAKTSTNPHRHAAVVRRDGSFLIFN